MLSRPPCEDHTTTCEICTIQFDIPRRGAREISDAQLQDKHLADIITSFEENDSNEQFKR